MHPDSALQFLAIGSTLCFQLAVDAGLGQHAAHLSPESLDRYFKVRFSLDGIAGEILMSFSCRPHLPLNWLALPEWLALSSR